ncbi:MAG: cytochrome-c peroxidase [Phycisphaerae bacterium]
MAQLPPVPVPAENPITEPKRVLGKILFWEEQLSANDAVACGTCHRPASAGADPRVGVHPGFDATFGTADDVIGSPGIARADANGVYYSDPLFGFDTQVTGRSAQAMLTAQYAGAVFWDGRAGPGFVDPETGLVSIVVGGGLEAQSMGPIMSDVEMAHDNRDWPSVTGKLQTVNPLGLANNFPTDVAAAMAGRPSYGDLFQAAYGTSDITAERIAFAIATYERTLFPDQTPWDQFVGGDANALTANQQAGWNAFQGSGCDLCHVPPLFTDNSYRNIGLRPVAEDLGRQNVTGDPRDRGRFKVPSLRNVGLKATYMHTGRLSSIGQVIDFYLGINGQVQFTDNQDGIIQLMGIAPGDVPPLIDFLENGLTDPRVAAETAPYDRPTLHTERLADLAMLADCMAGPDVLPSPQTPLLPADCLVRFDGDGDSDVDLVDAASF